MKITWGETFRKSTAHKQKSNNNFNLSQRKNRLWDDVTLENLSPFLKQKLSFYTICSVSQLQSRSTDVVMSMLIICSYTYFHATYTRAPMALYWCMQNNKVLKCLHSCSLLSTAQVPFRPYMMHLRVDESPTSHHIYGTIRVTWTWKLSWTALKIKSHMEV